MSRIDALQAIAKKFGVDTVQTSKDETTITVWLMRPPKLQRDAILNSVKDTGWFVAGFGHDVGKGQHFIRLQVEREKETE